MVQDGELDFKNDGDCGAGNLLYKQFMSSSVIMEEDQASGFMEGMDPPPTEDHLFVKQILTHSILLQIDKLHGNIDQLIVNELQDLVGNKCSKHGYIQRDSIRVLKRTVGKVNSSHLNGSLTYRVCYEANVCNPRKETIIPCKIVSTNKMGILAEHTPLTIVVAKHHHPGKDFDVYQVGETIRVKIIGTRFAMNDTQITTLAQLV